MTVKELIERLQTLAPDAEVNVRCGAGDFVPLLEKHIASFDFADDTTEPAVNLGE